MSSGFTIRTAGRTDEEGWRRLWQAYHAFYDSEISEAVTAATWARIASDDVPHVGSLIAKQGGGPLVGMLNYVLHDSTWASAPVCHLEDLYVAQDMRGGGIGRALIEDLAERGRKAGWYRVYWNTARDNSQAQTLYNKIAERTGWVRYELDLFD
jgi:GNAT superfamily N-acetyltransferase